MIALGCASAACTASEADAVAKPTIRQFSCEARIGFTVQIAGNRARVVTRNHEYDLEKRPTSFGMRYGSANVAFAQDEQRGVLIGAADGPYRRCLERGLLSRRQSTR